MEALAQTKPLKFYCTPVFNRLLPIAANAPLCSFAAEIFFSWKCFYKQRLPCLQKKIRCLQKVKVCMVKEMGNWAAPYSKQKVKP